MHTHKTDVHIHLVHVTDHVWKLYFCVCVQRNAKNQTWKMQTIQHVNETIKKTQQKTLNHIWVYTHKTNIHVHLVHVTDHVWKLYFCVCVQRNAKNQTWKMQTIQHANGATKKMKNTFSYCTNLRSFFFLLKIKFLKLSDQFCVTPTP